MGKPTTRKSNYLIRILMSTLTIVLIVLFLDIMSLVVDIQGTARAVNYAGLVRGTTQRIVKLEDAQVPQDKLISAVDSYIDGLRFGSDDLDLVRLDDGAFQEKMAELDGDFDELVREIAVVRDVGFENTDIIAKSEAFFTVCDDATGLAETYSQQKATALRQLENIVIVVIAGLIVIIGIELFRAVRFAAQNRMLQKKVYVDEATGLPNKNKCEELLDDPAPIPPASPVAVCVFDLNNLRTINNNFGHEKGDEYIRSFADQLGRIASDTCFVGRDGGDEFIAIIRNASEEAIREKLDAVSQACRDWSATRPDMPISYAVGSALSTDFESCTMRDLFRRADKNMYVDKNHAKMEEARARRRFDRKTLTRLTERGYRFSDCLYCDALLDQYRVLRASSELFLAEDGSFSGAAEQIVSALSTGETRRDLRRKLDLGYLARTLSPANEAIEILYRKDGRTGRLTLLFLDETDGALHHFALGFEPFFADASNEKQRLSHYYDQLKQSLLENGNYVEALLDSAQAAYSVDITHDRIERIFMQPKGTFRDLGVGVPYSYNSYCERRSRYITSDTLRSYLLVSTSEKLLSRFDSGTNQITIEYQEEGTDGKPLWLQKTVLMSRDTIYDEATGASEPVVRGIILFKDTSVFHEQEQLEKERLERALETADSESRAKTEFMSRMSHDFRTPINGIMGMLEIIRQSGQDPEKASECLDKIDLSANHLLDLVNDVLDMNKLEAGTDVLEAVPFDLDELLDEVRSLVTAQVEETRITHTRHRENVSHAHLIGSPLRVRQILLNLFSNAIKYNKPQGSIDTYTSELSSDGESALFEFKIVDTGIGMSEEFVENQLFRPFTQENFGARTQYKGTGLGMSIVHTLVERMGGSIEVQSTQGEGTAFTVRLPFEIDGAWEERSAQSAVECAEKSLEALQGAHVLLVEDNDINMEIAEFYLSSLGMRITKAWNGKEAVELFEESSVGGFSLILMDLMMPLMDGFAATRAIRVLARPDAETVPIVAMTANAFPEDETRAKEAGMNAHLAKPLDKQTLLKVIAPYVSRRE